MPELAKIIACGWPAEGWLLSKENKDAEKVSSILSSNVQHLGLRYCNLSDDFFPVVLQWFANVKELDLSGNNFSYPRMYQRMSLLN